MPAPPKLRYAAADVWCVEVHWKMESQKQRQTNGHVAVSAEVAIYLQGIAIQPEQILYPAVQSGIVEYTVNKVEADVIAYHCFLEEAYGNKEHALGKHVACNDQRMPYLGGEVARPDYGAGNELGEKRHKERIVKQRGQRFELSAIHIYRIAEALKREEAYANGQEDVPRLKVEVNHAGNETCKEIGVLEIAQHAQSDAKAQRNQHLWQQPALGVALPVVPYSGCNEIIAHGDNGQKHKVNTAALIIEVV